MLSMVTVVLPVFAIILAGFGARKVGVLGPHASLDLNRYVSISRCRRCCST